MKGSLGKAIQHICHTQGNAEKNLNYPLKNICGEMHRPESNHLLKFFKML